MMIESLIAAGYWLVPWSRSPRKPMVRDWLTKKPNADGFLRAYGDEIDWAIVPTDTVVLDIEMKNGLDGMRDLAEFGTVTPGAITITKSGGFHYWFRQPQGKTLTGGHHIRPGIEAKALNGSVHIPPSAGYSTGIALGCPALLPVLPGNLVAAWEKSATVRASRDGQYKTETYPVGERRACLCSMAGRLRSAGLTQPELIAALLAIRDNRCEDPGSFSDDEIIKLAKDYAKRPERGNEPTAPDCSWFPKT